MAIRKVSEGVSGWNSKTPFIKDRYTVRCLEEDFAPAKSSGNPMITRIWEICCPNPIAIGDRKIDIDGAKITQMCVTKVKNTKTGEWDEERSDKAFGRFRDDLLAVGYPSDEIDDENPPCFMKDKVVEAIVYARKDVARKTPTPEQARNKQPGDPIKDADGKDIETYTLVIETILGLSTVDTNRPY